MKRIKIDTRHMTDMFRLPCITKAYKAEGKTYLVFEQGTQRIRLTDGDCVVQTSAGEWYTELTTESHRFNSRIPSIINKIKEQ